MTAAVNVDSGASIHPQGGPSSADPHGGLRREDTHPTPASPALQYVTASVIPAAAQQLPRRSLSKNEYLYRQGDAAEQAFIIEAGLVALTLDSPADRDRVLALAGPGDVVGALAPNLLEYQDSAMALSGEVSVRYFPVRGGSTPEAGAEAEGEPPSGFEALLSAAAGEQLVRLTQALDDSAHPVPARVARALLRLGHRFGQRMDDGSVRLTLPVTHETLAAIVGAARETTTTVVQQLRERQLLQGTRGSYRFVPGALAEYAHQAALATR